MASLALFVHGLSPPSPVRSAAIEAAVGAQLGIVGRRPDDVRVHAWSSGAPRLVAAGAAAVTAVATASSRQRLGTTALASAVAAVAGVAGTYLYARRHLTDASRDLADRLSWERGRRDRIDVVAHSLGTEVVLGALTEIRRRGRYLPGAVILLAGTADAGADHAVAIDTAGDGVVNIWNPLDAVLLAARRGRTIGQAGLHTATVVNLETRTGHRAQIEAFGHDLRQATVRGVPTLA